TLFSNGTIMGSGAMTFSGELDWTGGTMNGDGSTTITGTLKLLNDNTTVFVDTRSLVNKGKASTWMGNSNALALSNGAVFTNSGTLTVKGNDLLRDDGGSSPSVVNSGTLATSGAGAVLEIRPFLSNSGTLSVGNGSTMNIHGGGM